MLRGWMAAGLALAVVLGCAGGAAPAGAGEAAAIDDARARVALAARQGMLGQRIASAACLNALGVAPEAQLERIREARALFETSLSGLRYGSDELGLAPEKRSAVQIALGEVDTLWTGHAETLDRALAKGGIDDDMLTLIAGRDPALLAATGEAATLIAQAAGTALPLHLVLATDIAERQRMLSQKMAKHACLVAKGIAAAENRAALSESIETFDLSLTALAQGYPELGIRRPQGEALAAKLAEAAEAWAALKPVLAAIAAGGAADRAGIERISAANAPLFAVMEEAVALYGAEG